MKNTLKILTLTAITFISFNAFADCSAAEKVGLLSCSSNSLLACRNQLPTCTAEPQQAISVQDVLTSTGTKCCALRGRKLSVKIAKQKACIGIVATRYARSVPFAHSSVKPFLKATRKALSAFRKAGCTTGSN